MHNYITDADTRAGTIAGTLLVVLCNIDASQLLNTVLVAATGAIASFITSAGCRYLWNRFGRQQGQGE